MGRRHVAAPGRHPDPGPDRRLRIGPRPGWRLVVVLLVDWRYAYGYADSEGRTRSIRVEKPVPFEVFWYDDAWNAALPAPYGLPFSCN